MGKQRITMTKQIRPSKATNMQDKKVNNNKNLTLPLATAPHVLEYKLSDLLQAAARYFASSASKERFPQEIVWLNIFLNKDLQRQQALQNTDKPWSCGYITLTSKERNTVVIIHYDREIYWRARNKHLLVPNMESVVTMDISTGVLDRVEFINPKEKIGKGNFGGINRIDYSGKFDFIATENKSTLLLSCIKPQKRKVIKSTCQLKQVTEIEQQKIEHKNQREFYFNRLLFQGRTFYNVFYPTFGVKHYGIVMPYIQGPNLADAIMKGEYSKLPLKTKLVIAINLGCLIKRLHNLNVVHKDIKLSNVIVTAGYVAIPIDYGFSQQLGEEMAFIFSDRYAEPALVTEKFSRTGQKLIVSKQFDLWSYAFLIAELIDPALLKINIVEIKDEKDVLCGYDLERFIPAIRDYLQKDFKDKELATLLLSMLNDEVSVRPDIDEVLTVLLNKLCIVQAKGKPAKKSFTAAYHIMMCNVFYTELFHLGNKVLSEKNAITLHRIFMLKLQNIFTKKSATNFDYESLRIKVLAHLIKCEAAESSDLLKHMITILQALTVTNMDERYGNLRALRHNLAFYHRNNSGFNPPHIAQLGHESATVPDDI